MRITNMTEETEKKDVELEQEVEELKEELQQAEEKEAEDVAEVNSEIEKLKEELVRMHAEMENMRKRNERELDNLRKYSLDKFAKALIPVADSMDKALEVGKDDNCEVTAEQMIEGTEMTQKVLLKVLKENGVEVINPAGEKFNPEFHEAMTQIPNPELEPNTVVDVFQKGYILNGRLVRPAMVVVSK
jgi:molecular chaperone GrpE